MRRFDVALLVLAVSSCATVKIGFTTDEVLTKADGILGSLEDQVSLGLYRSFELAKGNCRPLENEDDKYRLCIQKHVLPWYLAGSALSDAQFGLISAYKARLAGASGVEAFACVRESFATLTRKLRELKTSPPTDFANLVIGVLNSAKGAKCELH